MSLTKWKKPRTISLPGGYKIPVKYLSTAQMTKLLASDKTFSQSDLYGYWDGTQIVINRDEPLWTQVKTLGHELVHATHDYAHWLEETVVDPMKGEAGETLMLEDDDD